MPSSSMYFSLKDILIQPMKHARRFQFSSFHLRSSDARIKYIFKPVNILTSEWDCDNSLWTGKPGIQCQLWCHWWRLNSPYFEWPNPGALAVIKRTICENCHNHQQVYVHPCVKLSFFGIPRAPLYIFTASVMLLLLFLPSKGGMPPSNLLRTLPVHSQRTANLQ